MDLLSRFPFNQSPALLPSEFIAAAVVGVVAMTADPQDSDAVPLQLRVQHFPEVAILDWSL